MNLLQTLFRMTYCSLGLALVIFLLSFFVHAPSVMYFTWVCYVFFALMAFGFLGTVYLFKKVNPQLDATLVLLALLSFRFLMAATFIAVYILAYWKGGNEILIPFVGIYLFFTVVEMYFVNKYIQYLEQKAKNGSSK